MAGRGRTGARAIARRSASSLKTTRAGRMPPCSAIYLAPSYASAAPRRSRGARPADAHRSAGGIGQPALQAPGDRAEEGGKRRRLVFRLRPRLRQVRLLRDRAPRRSRRPSSRPAMDGVIAELREHGVTQDELDRARSACLAEFIYAADSQSRMARHYGWRAGHRHDRRGGRELARAARRRDGRGHPRRGARNISSTRIR